MFEPGSIKSTVNSRMQDTHNSFYSSSDDQKLKRSFSSKRVKESVNETESVGLSNPSKK